MELEGKFGERLRQRHGESIAQQREDSHQKELLQREQDLEKLQRALEIARLQGPYSTVKKLLESKGVVWGVPPTDERMISETFRLHPTSVGENISLKINFKTRGDEISIYNSFNISLMISSEDGVSEQYLTTIQKPLDRNGMPENYGMRTYTTGKASYEVNSYVPNDEEAEFIARVIQEAAEVSGIPTVDDALNQ